MGIGDCTNKNKNDRDTLPVQRHTLLLAVPVHRRLRITLLPIKNPVFPCLQPYEETRENTTSLSAEIGRAHV